MNKYNSGWDKPEHRQMLEKRNLAMDNSERGESQKDQLRKGKIGKMDKSEKEPPE